MTTSRYAIPPGYTRETVIALQLASGGRDMRTVIRCLRGGHVRGAAGDAIRAAMARYGITPEAPPKPEERQP